MKGLHKMRFGLRGSICLLLLIMTGSVVYAATPGGLEKKYVGLLFDVINNYAYPFCNSSAFWIRVFN